MDSHWHLGDETMCRGGVSIRIKWRSYKGYANSQTCDRTGRKNKHAYHMLRQSARYRVVFHQYLPVFKVFLVSTSFVQESGRQNPDWTRSTGIPNSWKRFRWMLCLYFFSENKTTLMKKYPLENLMLVYIAKFINNLLCHSLMVSSLQKVHKTVGITNC